MGRTMGGSGVVVGEVRGKGDGSGVDVGPISGKGDKKAVGVFTAADVFAFRGVSVMSACVTEIGLQADKKINKSTVLTRLIEPVSRPCLL